MQSFSLLSYKADTTVSFKIYKKIWLHIKSIMLIASTHISQAYNEQEMRTEKELTLKISVN